MPVILAPSRTKRRDPGGARVTPRDLLVLSFLEKAQPVTLAQVERLCSTSRHMAGRRLRVLRDLGLVHVHVTALHDPNRYTLAEPARPLLARALGRSPEEVRTSRGIGRVNLAHHEGAVDLWVALQVATARSRTWTLEQFRLESDIRRSLGDPAGAQVPDAVAVLVHAAGVRHALAFEVDLSTENPSWVASHKAHPYGALQAAGTPLSGCAHWAVCVVAPSRRRLHRLSQAAWEVGVPEGLFYFAVASEVTDRTVLTPVWVTPRVVDGTDEARLTPECPLPTVTTNRHHGRDGGPADFPSPFNPLSAEPPGSFWRGSAL